MSYRMLFVFIEGNDDERFFEKIVVPILERKYDKINLVKYSQMKKSKIKSFIHSIVSAGWDYIYVVDIDDSPCVTAKKQQIQEELHEIDLKKIIVVIKEIESWYLAGLESTKARELMFQESSTSTDNITKEHFNRMIPQNSSRIVFMNELLENFSLETAKRKNKSFRYFAERILFLRDF
jgi:hypothetical protein